MLTDSVQTWDITLQDLQCEASLEFAAPRLEGYEIIELIGEGTYGSVWLARETETGVIVAIKRFRRPPDEKCRAEVEHLAKLSAVRGIVALRKVHLQAEPYCYVMEHMPGGTLADLMRRDGPRGFQEAWRMFKQLVEALRDVHREGIVHGDIKPDNILLDAAGMPRLCDFGQARGRGSYGRALGTLFYMPPEQARMEGIPDPRWDVYALGAILYEMVTGSKPRFNAELSKLLTSPTSSGTETRDRLDQYARHLENNPSLEGHRHVSQIDASAARLIDRCLTIEFDERPTDANAIWRLMEDCEHSRRSKPLFIFGVLAPAVLFLLLGFAVLLSGGWMLARIKRDWQHNASASNRAIAQAIRSSLRDQFNDRLQIVQTAAKSKRMPAPLNMSNHENIVEFLKGLYEKHDKLIFRWALTDATGSLLANYGRTGEGDQGVEGEDPTNLNDDFSWRAWFNGQEDRRQTTTPDAANLADFRSRVGQLPFLTEPYVRKGNVEFIQTSISCPIATSETDEPIGILMGAFPYERLVGWMTDFVQAQSTDMRRVVVVNQNRHVVYHPLIQAVIEERHRHSDEPMSEAMVKPPDHFERAFANRADLGQFIDPLDDRSYLGSSAVLSLDNDQQFAIIVQQDVDTAMGPLRTLQRIVYSLGGGLLLVGAVFLASNTYALYWFLRNQRETAAHV